MHLLLLLHHLLLLSNAKLHIMRIISVLTRSHIFCIALNTHRVYGSASIDSACSLSSSSTTSSATSCTSCGTTSSHWATASAHHIILSVAYSSADLVIIMALHFLDI